MQILAALLTPTIAVFAALIAYLQWRTAHHKVMLDLFEKRLSVYEKTRGAVIRVMSSGRADAESTKILLEAINAATFLFGDDVNDYLSGLWLTFAGLHPSAFGTPSQRRHLNAIGAFHHHGTKLFAPYMQMDQKRILTPFQYIQKRNEIRLSYADEKQK